MKTISTIFLAIIILVHSTHCRFILKDFSLHTRVLETESQNYGNYKINATYDKSCKSFSTNDIVFTETELNKTVSSLNGFFEFSYEPFEQYLRTNNTSHFNDMAGKAILKVLFFIIMILLFLCTLPCIIGHFCCQCWCICCDGDDEILDDEKDSEKIKKSKHRRRQRRANRDKRFTSNCCRKFIKFTTYFLVLAVLVCTIGVMVQMFSSTKALNKTDCAISHTLNDLIRGRKDDYWRFGGLKGLRFLYYNLKEEITLITPNSVPLQNLNSQASTLRTNLDAFYNSHKTVSVSDCRGSGTVVPDIIHYLIDKINPDIAREIALLESTAKVIHTGGEAANKISVSGAQVLYKLVIDLYMQEIDQFIENVTIAERNITDSLILDEVSTGFKIFTITSAIVVIGLLVCFAFIMCCLFHPKYFKKSKSRYPKLIKWNKLLLGGVSFFKVCCGLLCLVIGLLILVFSFIFVNVCHSSHKGIHDREFAAQVINNTETFRYLDLCLFEDSSGDLGELLIFTHRSTFQDLTDMFNGINVDYSTLNISEATTPSVESYGTNITKFVTWEAKDYTNPSITNQGSAPYQYVTQANSILSCLPTSGEQKISLYDNDCKSTLQKSTLSDAEPYRNTLPYCLIPSKFQWTTLPTRYTSSNPFVSCASTVDTVYASLKSCVDSHDSKMNDFKSSFGSDIQNTANNLKASIKASKEATPGWGDHFENNNILTESRAFLKGEKLNQLQNCKILRFSVVSLLGSSCDASNTWTVLSFWLMFQGISFGLLGIVVWFWSLGKMNSQLRAESYKEVKKTNKNSSSHGAAQIHYGNIPSENPKKGIIKIGSFRKPVSISGNKNETEKYK